MPEIYDGNDNPAYDYGVLTGDNTRETLPDSSLQDWGSWARDIGQTVLTGAVDIYKYQAIGRNGGIPAIGSTGRVYTEGRTTPQPATVAGLGVSPMVLMLAAAGIAAVLLLRK